MIRCDQGVFLRRGGGAALALGLCGWLWAAQTGAEEPRRVLFDIDDPPEHDHQLLQGLTFGVDLDTELFFLSNGDLDSAESDRLTNVTPALGFALAYEPGGGLEAFLEVQLERAESFGASAARESDQTRLLLDEAYIGVRDLVDGISFRIGRSRLRDPREWLLDQELDAVRVFARRGDFGLEASVSRFRLLEEDLLNEDEREEITNYYVIGRYEPSADLGGRAYVLVRDNQDARTDDLTFFGLHGAARIGTAWDLWLDAAHVRGREDGASVRGYGFDAGAVFAPELPLRPSATLGFAFGSGDGDPDDGRDHAFRQTGLQENEDAFNGVTRFLYYGEALDPELSNLAILTFGLGLRPSALTSIDLVYHRYWQHRARDSLGDAAITAGPDGAQRHIGDGLDLVVGVSELEGVDLDFTLGGFFPGTAFEDEADPAFVATFELAIEF